MPQESLSDDELKSFENSLNRFDAVHIRDALEAVSDRPVKGNVPTASGPLDFGSVPAGVLVYRSESGGVRLRLTVTETTGASYEEFELSDERFIALAQAAIERLEERRS
jgi:hypothetical protein